MTLIFLTIFGLSFMGAMSPGPDLIVVTKNVLSYGRSHGLATAAGIALALFTYSIIAATGIGIVIQDNPHVFMTIKILGSLYLIYLGYTVLTTKNESKTIKQTGSTQNYQSILSSFSQGYLTNIGNPKAIIFIIAVFSQLIEPTATIAVYIISACAIASSAWVRFSVVSCLLGHSVIQTKLNVYQSTLNKTFGVLLLLLASAILVG